MSAFKNVFRTGYLSVYAGILTTGIYVTSKDYYRLQRMVSTYEKGKILPPLADNNLELFYQERKKEETILKSLLDKTFTNEYYVLNGEVGVGKSRLVRKVVNEVIDKSGKARMGAPIYVTADQGKTFPDTLAKAVNFYFDEHINFNSFVNIVFKIESLPARDEKSKLTRVLAAIEESAFLYVKKYQQPVVLIIDNISFLNKQMPNAVKELQNKAKLWADCNIVKLVLVNNDEELELEMQNNSSAWSRVASPILIPELSHQEAIQFLTSYPMFQKDENKEINPNVKLLTVEEAEEIVFLVGGRISDLIIFKSKHRMGMPLISIEKEVIMREQEKFVNVSKTPHLWKLISKLREMPDKIMILSKFIKLFNKKDVDALCELNIIKSVLCHNKFLMHS